MNCATDFIITTLWPDGGLVVWTGRGGWQDVPKHRPQAINDGYRYPNRQRVEAAIKRQLKKRPNSLLWNKAGHCTIDEAHAIDWNVP